MARAALFAGQGAQVVGMGKDLAERHAVAAQTFAEADRVLGMPLSRICFEGPLETLSATDVQQPAIFTVGVALFRTARELGLFGDGSFIAMGGLSLGEYTALHAAGALNFEDALRLLQTRGRLMQQACDANPGGMVSLMGMDEAAALRVCEQVAQHGYVAPANYNCPGQIVLSGVTAACEAAVALVERSGEGKAVPLKVAGAFHSELMRPAAEGLREPLAAATFRAPTTRVVGNVDANYHEQPDAIRASLYRQVFNPVRWEQCCRRMIADGCSDFVEFGPGRVLTGLLRKIDRSVKCVTLSTAADLEAAVAAAGGAG